VQQTLGFDTQELRRDRRLQELSSDQSGWISANAMPQKRQLLQSAAAVEAISGFYSSKVRRRVLAEDNQAMHLPSSTRTFIAFE
jgi:hypothetical protein